MSLKAFLRNWSAFLVLALVWLGVCLGIGFTAGLMMALMTMLLGKLAVVGILLMLPFLWLIMVLGILQSYTAYRNVWTNLPME